jgi:peptidoglycan-N-acetylglucosamine deacetylase
MRRSGCIIGGASVAAVLFAAGASAADFPLGRVVFASQGSPSAAAAGRQPDQGPLPPAPPIIRRVDNDEMRIALRFDACATQNQGFGFDRGVYAIIQREQVPATIFVSGRWVEFHPREMEELVADPLVEFANHSYSHKHMPNLSVQEIGSEIDRTEEALARYGRRSVAFRPPFGSFSERVLEVVHSRRMPAILWDVVSGDPGAKATVASITKAVLSNTRSGSIVIFHINARAPQTKAALPHILRELRARGFEFVHISTLLASSTDPSIVSVPPEAPGTPPPAAPAPSPSPSPSPSPAPAPLRSTSPPPALPPSSSASPPPLPARPASEDDDILPPSLPPDEGRRRRGRPGALVPASDSPSPVGRP